MIETFEIKDPALQDITSPSIPDTPSGLEGSDYGSYYKLEGSDTWYGPFKSLKGAFEAAYSLVVSG